MSGSGQEAIPNVRELSVDSLGCPGVIVRPSQMSRSGREALPNVRQCSGFPLTFLAGSLRFPVVVGNPPRCPGVVRRPSRIFGCGR